MKNPITHLLFGCQLLAAFCFLSCTPTDETFRADTAVKLGFSADTVFFDTVFTDLGSITKRLSVINPKPHAIEISEISLKNATTSPYALIINGVPTQGLKNVKLLGKDSLLILIKIHLPADTRNRPFVAEDEIVFTTTQQKQRVKLLAWGQNARFFKGGLQRLPCASVWDSLRPYVLYDSVWVPENCTLTIKAGTRVHLNAKAALFVQGRLQIEGTAAQPVVFEGMRPEKRYQNLAGQWDGIYFLEGSKDNEIRHAHLKNGNVGLYLGTPDDDDIPDLRLSHSIIQNMRTAGIRCFSADLYMYNSVISNCGQHTFTGLAGGNYVLHHNTFLNYQLIFRRNQPSNLFSDLFETEKKALIGEDLRLEMINNIVWGSLTEELQLMPSGKNKFQAEISHNLLRTKTDKWKGQGNLLNKNPMFRGQPDAQNFNFKAKSPVKDAGIILQHITDDLAGKPRDRRPDLGALEYSPPKSEK